MQSVDNGGRHSEAAAVQGKPVAPPATPPFIVQSSLSSDRSDPTALDGTTVKGSIYVFTGPEASVKKSEFWLDSTDTTGDGNALGDHRALRLRRRLACSCHAVGHLGAVQRDAHDHSAGDDHDERRLRLHCDVHGQQRRGARRRPPPPAAPTNVKATPGNGSVDLTWDATSGTTVGYNVYRAAATPVSITGTPLNGTTLISGNSFHDGAAANGQFWYYVVQSVDSIGQHSEAHSLSAKPAAPVTGPAYQVTLSGSADRSAGQNLNGLVVSGDAYIFTSPATSVKTVQFWLDDPTMAGPVTRNETTTPYDFIGGSPAAASPYDTHALPDGVHTITQKVTTTSNVVLTTTATFKVVNSHAAAARTDGHQGHGRRWRSSISPGTPRRGRLPASTSIAAPPRP